MKSAFVSAALLAALAMSCGTAYANSSASGAGMVRTAFSTLKTGDAKTAIGQFTVAIDSGLLEPELKANALLNRALAYQQTGNHERAIADYSDAMALDVMAPSLRATALYNRGISNFKLRHLQAAIEDYTSSLLLNPRSAFSFYSRGNALRDAGQYLFALSDYERALRYGHPDKPRVLLASANTYIALNRPNDARKALNAALEANPDFGEARAQLILLGDQDAKAHTPAVDPIATGSVAALAGGTVAVKLELPAPVSPPSALALPVHGKKLFVDRVPAVEPPLQLASAQMTAPEEEVIEVDPVPETEEIPEETSAETADPAPEPAVKLPTAEAEQVEEETEQPQPTLGKWSVQVASAESEDSAWSTWKKMQARYKVLKAKKPVVVRADLGAKGIYYRVRLGGFEDQKAAAHVCNALKSSGVNCYISRTDG